MATAVNSIDFSRCIQSAGNIGSTTFYNICNHTTSVVPWGSADWTSAAAGTFLVAVVLALVIVFGVFIWKNT